MEINPDLIIPFEKLRHKAIVKDRLDGRCETAINSAFRCYEALVKGDHRSYQIPTFNATMEARIKDKLFFAWRVAEADPALANLLDGIIAVRVALGIAGIEMLDTPSSPY